MRLHEAARERLGVPFLHLGRDPAIGLDCVGLLADAAPRAGIPEALTHDLEGYSRTPHDGVLDAQLFRAFGAPVLPSTAQADDIVSLRHGGPDSNHVGILGELPDGRLSLIHTSRSIGRVVEHGLDDRWRRRIAAVYRPVFA